MNQLGLFLALGSFAFGAEYSVDVIPPPSGFTGISLVSGINNSGQVAGFGFNGNTTQAFIGSPEGSIPVPMPAGFTSAYAFAINDSGQVAGSAMTPEFPGPQVEQAFIGTPAGATLVPLPPGFTYSEAYGVNDSGVVVGGGGSYGSGLYRVFVGSVEVPLSREWTTGLVPESFGYAINNAGQITGYVAANGAVRAFIGTAHGVELIPTPPGWNGMGHGLSGYGLNAPGDVVETNGLGVFVYTASGTVPIPLPPGARGIRLSPNAYQNINSGGSVVGTSDAGAWLWNGSRGTVLLNTLVPPGWSVTDALGISDSGFILATASYNGGVSQFVELTPARAAPSRRPR
jgi:hypothetical protein